MKNKKQRLVDKPDEGICILDLHTLSHHEAIELADQMIRAAYENGRSKITIIHGSPLVYHHSQIGSAGKGSIKWALRGMLSKGKWKGITYHRKDKRHEIYAGEGDMVIALKPNLSPRTPATWPPLPEMDA